MSKRGKRRALEIASIAGTTRLLKDILNDPQAFREQKALKRVLSTQGLLAKHHDIGRGIVPMSLNHFKAIANLTSTDEASAPDVISGFSRLDLLRREAASALAEAPMHTTSPNSSTSKASLSARVEELEALVLQLREDAFLLQAAFDLRCRQAKAYAEEAGPRIAELCLREQRELDLTFSLCHRRFNTGNVTCIEEARRGRSKA